MQICTVECSYSKLLHFATLYCETQLDNKPYAFLSCANSLAIYYLSRDRVITLRMRKQVKIDIFIL